MSFAQLIHDALGQGLEDSLWAFRPELALCATIIGMLLLGTIVPRWKSGAFYVMLLGTAVAWYFAIPEPVGGNRVPAQPQALFTGLLVCDGFSIFLRGLLLSFALLFATFTQVSGVPEAEDATEFYVLILGALLGMCLMVSANHMLMVVLGVEMASVPSYVLAGILRHRRVSTEAALKYAVFGAAAAGVMLYGISLLVGVLGSAHLPTMAAGLARLIQHGLGGDQAMVLVLGGLMLMVGLAFKLSAVPCHFWVPDVFEGAPAEVGAFLSVASKAAALGLLVRLALGFGFVSEPIEREYAQRAAFQRAAVELGWDDADAPADLPESRLSQALEPAREYISGLIALLAAVTCTFGNLAAYGQTNMKRLLAYSTIAHAGYMMMPVAAAVAVAGSDRAAAEFAVGATAFYLGIYLFMNLGAFAFVAFLRNAAGSEAIADYAGLMRRSPGLTVCMSIILFSLVGLPPLAGFAAKFAIFAALFDTRLLVLLVIGGLNTVLSLFYYLRVVRVMIFAPEPADHPAPHIPLSSIPGAYLAVLTLPLVVLFVWWDGLFRCVQAAASSLLH